MWFLIGQGMWFLIGQGMWFLIGQGTIGVWDGVQIGAGQLHTHKLHYLIE